MCRAHHLESRSPTAGRNWDYRYCWLREPTSWCHALNRLGATLTMETTSATSPCAASETDGGLKPVTVSSRKSAGWTVDNLAAYRGMGPVRVGKSRRTASAERSYGQHHPAAAQMFSISDWPVPGDGRALPAPEAAGERARPVRRGPDAGPWDNRDGARPHFSSVMCWVACDRWQRSLTRSASADRAAYGVGRPTISAPPSSSAPSIRPNSFVSTLGGSDIDASLLLLQEIGFVSATDPRFLGTVAAVERVLRRGNHPVAPTRRRMTSACRARLSGLHASGTSTRGSDRTPDESTGDVRACAALPPSCRPAVGNIDPATRAVGQLPADLLFGGRSLACGSARPGSSILARLVVVSNRVALPRERGGAAAGLAVAMRDALRTRRRTVVRWSGRTRRRAGGAPDIVTGGKVVYATLDLSHADHGPTTSDTANSVRAAVHLSIGLFRNSGADPSRAICASMRPAAALKPLLLPDDLIWAHDYHLIPFAAELRKLGVQNRIGSSCTSRFQQRRC